MKVVDRILSLSAYTADIDVPLDQVDIADWLLTLPEAEYQRCCVPDHIASGITTTDDGRRMVINVEMIGTSLVVQHYIVEEAGKAYCRLNSISDVFAASGRSRVNVLWELIAERIDDRHTRYTNRVTAHPTDAFMAFLDEHGISFEDAANARQAAGGDHNRRETPLFRSQHRSQSEGTRLVTQELTVGGRYRSFTVLADTTAQPCAQG